MFINHHIHTFNNFLSYKDFITVIREMITALQDDVVLVLLGQKN